MDLDLSQSIKKSSTHKYESKNTHMIRYIDSWPKCEPQDEMNLGFKSNKMNLN